MTFSDCLQAAFNAFLSAGPHDVVRQIQQGKVAQPSQVAAAAAQAAVSAGDAVSGRPQRPASRALHDWLLAEQAVKEAATTGEIKVGRQARQSRFQFAVVTSNTVVRGRAGQPLPYVAAVAASQMGLWRLALAQLVALGRRLAAEFLAATTNLAAWSHPPHHNHTHRHHHRCSQVLSVDDDPINQMVIQNMLTKAGFSVLKAPDGQKALDMLEVGAALPEWLLPCRLAVHRLIGTQRRPRGAQLVWHAAASRHIPASCGEGAPWRPICAHASAVPPAPTPQDCLAHGSPPHVMLLDVMMPGLSG